MVHDELHVVFGASGALGNAVVRELVAQGKRIKAVNHNGKANVPNRVEVVKSNATDSTSIRPACEETTIVYNSWTKSLRGQLRLEQN